MDTREAMDAFCKAFSTANNVTIEEAARVFKEKFMRKEEYIPQIPRVFDPNRPVGEPGEMAAIESERAKTERLRMEMEQKRLDADQKRLDAEDRKLVLAEKKLDQEQELKKLELKQEKEFKERVLEQQKQTEDRRFELEKERNATERMIQLQSIGKKPDDMIEFLKSQNEKDKEAIKASAERDKEFYKNIMESKDNERDREYEYKKELAKIEADREVEMEKLRQTTDSETSSSTEAVVSMLAEKLDGFAAQNSKISNADDFVKKMEEYNKMQDTVVKSSLNILKARGFSEEQLAVVKSAVSSEEDRQKSTIGKVWEVGKEIWKQIEPRILPPEPTPEQALAQQHHAVEQQRLAREREEKLRKDVEIEARRLTTENAVLEQEKARLSQIEETNRSLQQKYYEQRNILINKAMDIGVPVNDEMSNEQIFMAIEQRESEIERQHKANAERAERAARERENQEQVAAAIESEQIAETAEKIEPAVEPEKPDVKPDEIEAAPEVLEKEAPGRKKKKTKSGKDKVKYTIYREDGTEIAQVESNNHKNAGLKVANTLNGTPENPVRIKVSSESGEEKLYDAYSAQVVNKAGTMYAVPRVKAAQA